MKSLKGKVAIVTGGAKGIGRAIVDRFGKEGAIVVIVDIDEKAGEDLEAKLKKKGQQVSFIKCDVTDSLQIEKMVRKVFNNYNTIDILVNNAGGVFGPEGRIEEVTEEQWDKVLTLNLKSQFLCCKAVVPHMKKKRYGKIINISSLGAIYPTVSTLLRLGLSVLLII